MNIKYILVILMTLSVYTTYANIFCPPNKTLFCNDDIYYLPLTGKPTVINYPYSLAKYFDISSLNQCRVGNVQRIWYIDQNQDGSFQSSEPNCSQTLTLQAVSDQIIIDFPEDKMYMCKEDIVTDKPTWSSGPCDVLGYNISETIFEVAPDACYKIYRKYTVINWCTYNGQNSNNHGLWTHTQIIKVIEKTPPTIKDCTNKIIGVESDCKATFSINNSAFDDALCASQELTWTVDIDLWADGTTDFRYGQNETGPFKLNPVGNNQEISITLPDRVSVGKHKVYWSVRDQCGNFKTCLTYVETKDLKKPTPYFHDFLTAAFQGNIMNLVISASIFNIASFDNCTPASKLKYSFSPNVNDTIRTITCSSAGFRFFTIYVTDLDGNQESIDVFMLIFDNGTCNVSSGISGRITESNSRPIENVTFSLSREGGDTLTTYTDADGRFIWTDISFYDDYTIIPDFSTHLYDRIDIGDIKKLQNYIMGLDHLVNFEYLAADLNGDKKIKISDLELLKKIVLTGSSTDQSNWFFASETDTIHDVNSLKNINSSLEIMRYDGNADFKAVYKGDITGANYIESDPRSITFLTKKVNGNIVDFYLSEKKMCKGLQVELVLPELNDKINIHSDYFELSPNSMKFDNQNNVIRFLTTEEFSITEDLSLFTVTMMEDLEAKQIMISSFSKMINEENSISKIKIRTGIHSESEVGISPNPGYDIFHLDHQDAIISAIYDLNGQSIEFKQNNRDLTLIAQTGIYLVKIILNGNVYFKKLVKY